MQLKNVFEEKQVVFQVMKCIQSLFDFKFKPMNQNQMFSWTFHHKSKQNKKKSKWHKVYCCFGALQTTKERPEEEENNAKKWLGITYQPSSQYDCAFLTKTVLLSFICLSCHTEQHLQKQAILLFCVSFPHIISHFFFFITSWK